MITLCTSKPRIKYTHAKRAEMSLLVESIDAFEDVEEAKDKFRFGTRVQIPGGKNKSDMSGVLMR